MYFVLLSSWIHCTLHIYIYILIIELKKKKKLKYWRRKRSSQEWLRLVIRERRSKNFHYTFAQFPMFWILKIRLAFIRTASNILRLFSVRFSKNSWQFQANILCATCVLHSYFPDKKILNLQYSIKNIRRFLNFVVLCMFQ